MGAPTITLHVVESSERTARILEEVRKALHRKQLTPGEGGLLTIDFIGEDLTQAEADAKVRAALDAADSDWYGPILMANPPPETG